MVVVITSTGGVNKRLFTFGSPVDPGLTDWAGSYLNERLAGTGLGARRLMQRLFDPSLSRGETDFLTALLPVFTDLSEAAEDSIYIDGTSRLMALDRSGDVTGLNTLMDMLERRVTMLGILRVALGGHESGCGSAPRTTSPRCSRSRWSPPATDCRSATSARCR